jgi:hypothetical protein
MNGYGKKLYTLAVRLNAKLPPFTVRAIAALVFGAIAGDEQCKGRGGIAYVLLGFGMFVALGGLCRSKTKKG